MGQSEKIKKKAAKVGFDWPEIGGAVEKLEEELGELRQAIVEGVGVEEELGDLLFAAVNVARFAGYDPEQALQKSSEKFISRFRYLEQAALAEGKKLELLSLEEQEALYQRSKQAGL